MQGGGGRQEGCQERGARREVVSKRVPGERWEIGQVPGEEVGGRRGARRRGGRQEVGEVPRGRRRQIMSLKRQETGSLRWKEAGSRRQEAGGRRQKADETKERKKETRLHSFTASVKSFSKARPKPIVWFRKVEVQRQEQGSTYSTVIKGENRAQGYTVTGC